MGRMTRRLSRTIPRAAVSVEDVGERDASSPSMSDALGVRGVIRRWAERATWAATHCEPLSLREALGCGVESTPYGECLMLDTHFPLSSNHGERPVGALFQKKSMQLDVLAELTGDPRLEAFCPQQTLFIDIEASGLRHGAGTYAFIVGLGFYDAPSSAFIVRQLVLDEPSSEQALLHVLVEHIDRFPFLASFNGKSYDLTVLISRLIAQRFYTKRECNLKLRPHLDLVHLCKSVYRGCWSDGKLQTLERHALGFERVDDVPGSLVPSCWYHYLRTADPRPVVEVARHNLFDVISMVTLADKAIMDVNPLSAAPPTSLLLKRVHANVGRLWLRRGRPELAWHFLNASLTQPWRQHRWLEQAFRDSSVAVRRAGTRDERQALLRRWREVCPESEAAWTASAIFFERVVKDLRRALMAARSAHVFAPSPHTVRRLSRLQTRLERVERASRVQAQPLQAQHIPTEVLVGQGVGAPRTVAGRE